MNSWGYIGLGVGSGIAGLLLLGAEAPLGLLAFVLLLAGLVLLVIGLIGQGVKVGRSR